MDIGLQGSAWRGVPELWVVSLRAGVYNAASTITMYSR